MSEVFTGTPGKFVELADTLAGFEALLDGSCDEYPE
jgi:F-type H+-transporting ATPase subunit beta